MAGFMKKQSVSFYFKALAMIIGIAGLIATVVSSSMNSSNVLTTLTVLMIEGIIAIALIALAIYAPNRWGNYDYIGSVSILASIALLTTVIGGIISERILLISGLFSFNSGNTDGWSVFYVSVAAIACLLVSIVLLIVSAFMKSTK